MPLAPWHPEEIVGQSALLIVAPHGGRRDHAAVPWGSRHLRMNDVQTADLARELAAVTGASAVINPDLDRNVVDLNRLSAVVAQAPAFLDAIARALHRGLATHDRITLILLHGWNVGHPSVDLGFGVRPGHPEDSPSISDGFQQHTLWVLVGACVAAGATATLGEKYPGRARENLVQLFTGRYADDPRPSVAACARHAGRVDAIQVELGLPLRLPGPRRRRWVAAWSSALRESRPAARGASAPAPPALPARGTTTALAVQFVSPTLCGMLRSGPHGALLVVVLPDGRVVNFTAERVGSGGAEHEIAGWVVTRSPRGWSIRYEGPALLFPDTRPFEDLERALHAAQAVEVDMRLEGAASPGGFSPLRGTIHVDTASWEVDAASHTATGAPFSGAFSGALDFGNGRTLLLDTAAGASPSVACAGYRRLTARFPPRVALDLVGADGTPETLEVELTHQVPVVPNGAPPGTRSVHAVCRVPSAHQPAGWLHFRGF